MPVVLLGEATEGALRLNERLREALAAVGLEKHAGGSFTPHVTLAYADRIKAVVLPEPVRWTVGRLVLLKGRDRVPGYDEVAGWELEG